MLPLYKITFVILLLQLLRICKSLTDLDEQSAQELRDSKKALMNTLGLEYVPRIVPAQADFLLRRCSAPKFMMGLFKEVSSEVHHNLNRSSGYYEVERKYLDENEVDTVISFFKYDFDKSWNHVRDELKLKFKTKFNVKEDIIQGGELKIFKRSPRNKNIVHENCSVSIFLIFPGGATPQLIDEQKVHTKKGWLTFNVTAAVKQWAHFPDSNHGLKVVVRHAGKELSPHSFGIVGMRGNLEKRPYLVAFATTTRDFPTFTSELMGTSRERRAAQEDWKTAANTDNECKLKKFYVNFKEIGLHNTIVAPSGYDMFLCQGLCTYPLDDIETTNHAILQSLSHLYDSSAAPEPCCVPGNLKSISLLFFDNDENIVLKQHPKMVATSCVCH